MRNNHAWNLESFLDSLIVELDKSRETLAVKAINNPLTYAVKDVNLEMQLFPSYDGKRVQFVTAQPGESGASKIVIQLGSITDQQIRKSTKGPITRDDLNIEVIEDIDEETKDSLRKIGVTSVNDLNEIERKNVDIETVSDRKINRSKLAGLLRKARRGKIPPSVSSASFRLLDNEPLLIVEGENLSVDQSFQPVAVFNGYLAEVKRATSSFLALQIDPVSISQMANELIMTVDPFTVFKININKTITPTP